MAKKGGNPKNLKPPFPPGVSGNPSGRPKTPPDILEARKLTQNELERIVNKFLYLDRAAIAELVKTPGTPMIELVVASILAQAAQKGDQQRLEFVLQRMIGKVKDQIEVTLPKPFIVSRLDGSSVEMGAKLPPKDEE
jgi:hypothetical protein